MLALKKEPPRAQVLFRDADKLAANGYALAPTPFSHGQPLGPWAAIYNYHDSHRETHVDDGISVLLGARPNHQHGLYEVRDTWCASLTVRTHDRSIAKEVDALIASRLVWREGVSTRFTPVRCTEGSLKTLRPFALTDGAEPFSLSRSPRLYSLPREPGRYMSVEVKSACQQFVHSGLDVDNAPHGIGNDPKGAPFYWRNNLDLTRVRRDQLPILRSDAADALSREIEGVFEAHGADWT